MRAIRNMSAVIAIILSSYSLMTTNYKFLPYAIILLGIMNIATGILELRENRKTMAIILFLVAIFVIFVSADSIVRQVI